MNTHITAPSSSNPIEITGRKNRKEQICRDTGCGKGAIRGPRNLTSFWRMESRWGGNDGSTQVERAGGESRYFWVSLERP